MTELERNQKILADTLFDLNPAKSREEWEEHVKQNGHDANAFFGNNGAGREEYERFISVYDKERHDRSIKQKRRK